MALNALGRHLVLVGFMGSGKSTRGRMAAERLGRPLLVGRGGSKGLPGKNLREIAGLSLIGYKAKSARQSRYCSRLIVSSDSAEIRNEAVRHGADHC